MRAYADAQFKWMMLELHQIWATLIFLVTVNFDFDGSMRAWITTIVCFASLLYFTISFWLSVGAKKDMITAKERLTNGPR